MAKDKRLYDGVHECCEPRKLILSVNETGPAFVSVHYNQNWLKKSLNQIDKFLIGCLTWKN